MLPRYQYGASATALQNIVYDHAAVAFSGANTYLFFIDFDEYTFFPQATCGIHCLLDSDGCLGKLHPAEVFEFRRLPAVNCSQLDEQSQGFDEKLNKCFDQWESIIATATTLAPKSLALADVIASTEVHWVHVLPGASKPATVPLTCAFAIDV